MVTVIRRMRKLRALLAIRLGPGAAVLPQDVKRLHMDFAYKLDDGHFGARKFWRKHLPRLKYHNPSVSMTVNRSTDQGGPATLSVFFAPPSNKSSPLISPASSSSTAASASSSPSNQTISDRIESIEMKHKNESEIYSLLVKLTGATPVEPTRDELAELQQIEEQRKKSEQDSAGMAAVNETRAREKAILQQARGGVTYIQAT